VTTMRMVRMIKRCDSRLGILLSHNYTAQNGGHTLPSLSSNLHPALSDRLTPV